MREVWPEISLYVVPCKSGGVGPRYAIFTPLSHATLVTLSPKTLKPAPLLGFSRVQVKNTCHPTCHPACQNLAETRVVTGFQPGDK